MTWTPGDYYRASRAARTAWQATSQQLALALDETDQVPQASPGSVGLVERTTLNEGEATEPRYGMRGADGAPDRGRARGNAGASVATP